MVSKADSLFPHKANHLTSGVDNKIKEMYVSFDYGTIRNEHCTVTQGRSWGYLRRSKSFWEELTIKLRQGIQPVAMVIVFSKTILGRRNRLNLVPEAWKMFSISWMKRELYGYSIV